MLRLCEIFKSIDGEANGWNGAGEQTLFIRLQGCNLRCKYCDTKHAQSCTSGDMTLMSLLDVAFQLPVKKVARYKKVTITGGEPLLQAEVWSLIDLCLSRELRVTVETNGTCWIPSPFLRIPEVRFIVDWKLPSAELVSGPEYNICNYGELRPYDVIKFVILTREDYSEAKELVNRYDDWSARKVLSIGFAAPCADDPTIPGRKELIEHILKDADERFQLQLQLHKILKAHWGIHVK